MSKVAIQGNASGTGTFTIAAPNSNTDRTLTLPDEAGTVVTTGGTGSVSADMLASTLDLSGKTVTLPAGTGGKVLQVVQTVKTDVFSTTSSAFVGVTGLSASITPSSTSSTILIMGMVHGSSDENYDGGAGFRIYKNGSVLSGAIGNAAGSRTTTTVSAVNRPSWNLKTSPILYMDSPSTTSSTTYQFYLRSQSGRSVYVNSSYNDADTSDRLRAVSSIVLMEIAG